MYATVNEEGDETAWHFDEHPFSAVLLLSAAEEGEKESREYERVRVRERERPLHYRYHLILSRLSSLLFITLYFIFFLWHGVRKKGACLR